MRASMIGYQDGLWITGTTFQVCSEARTAFLRNGAARLTPYTRARRAASRYGGYASPSTPRPLTTCSPRHDVQGLPRNRLDNVVLSVLLLIGEPRSAATEVVRGRETGSREGSWFMLAVTATGRVCLQQSVPRWSHALGFVPAPRTAAVPSTPHHVSRCPMLSLSKSFPGSLVKLQRTPSWSAPALQKRHGRRPVAR